MQLAEFEETRGGAKGGRWGREGKEASIRALFASGLCVWFVCYVMFGICAKQYAMYVCLGKVTYFWVKRYG